MRKYLALVLIVGAILLLFAAGCTRKEHPDEDLLSIPSPSAPTVVSVEQGGPIFPTPTPLVDVSGSKQPKAVAPTATNAPTPTPTATPLPTKKPTPRPTTVPTSKATQPNPTAPPTVAPTTAPTQTPKAEAQYITYKVKPGDTLFSIAAAYGTTVAEVMRVNGLKSYTIYVGQSLKVPVGYVSYTVKPGDTLYSIALTHHVTTSALIAANHISNPNLLFVGQRLIIPTKGSTMPVMGKPVYHVVKPGETLVSISQKYGVNLQALQIANHLANPNLIYVGQRLRIP